MMQQTPGGNHLIQTETGATVARRGLHVQHHLSRRRSLFSVMSPAAGAPACFIAMNIRQVISEHDGLCIVSTRLDLGVAQAKKLVHFTKHQKDSDHER
ncbi:hypothetical protein J4734_15140 [Klebsiella pneumoniae]|uniref:Uncharacterized protein n=1 Tax=Klebsiella pneumoniae TaxID=573 RepID=A0A939SQ71_KLEPN|nr:hypothetical protein [Klebsiella pneumoniae]